MSLQKLMLSVFAVTLAIGVVLSAGCARNEPAAPTQKTALPPISTRTIQDVTPQEAFALIQENQSNQDFVILDVRTPEEFADGHIEKANNLDFYSPGFRNQLNALDKSKTYLVYCRSGSRSFNAAKIMEELKFKKVYNVLDGIIRWRAEGLPTVK